MKQQLLYSHRNEDGLSEKAALESWTPSIIADGRFFASLEKPVSVYVLRHGQSEGNATGTFQGKLDFPLDKRGKEQAKASAIWLAGQTIDTIAASPQKRAAETASLIATACGIEEIRFLDSLVEVDVGIFGGLTWESSKTAYPEVYKEFQYRSWDAVPEAETSKALYQRAIASWGAIRELAEEGAEKICCVSHGGLIQWLLRSTFGAKSWLPLIPTSNCGISRFDIEPTAKGMPAFIQWGMINFKAPGLGEGAKPVF
ncbi:MAG: histidine phosphatase family protein [Spirochaetia bacterium]|jgi:broad specificity phosphatase PhoE|nr:histidine phosphatase family protein [Spirochaetia bacterium]